MNYQKKLDELIEKLQKDNAKPTLLLHACCAPCSSYCLEYLSKTFDITVLFYNPNIESEMEFNKRVDELIRFIDECRSIEGVNLEILDYDNSEFYNAVEGLEDEKEGGVRCFKCYELRLRKTAEYAKEHNFEYITTTLTISPHKNSEKINEIGLKVADEYGLKYLLSDFKKNDGFKRSIELSKEYDLYRQSFCGCEFSKRD
ncbi:MAG: epoxyqueuosine reductase QueH [Eubacterium sp.]|nr:epoxyqueuosine reductase QueH [Eubacterium sp.]